MENPVSCRQESGGGFELIQLWELQHSALIVDQLKNRNVLPVYFVPRCVVALGGHQPNLVLHPSAAQNILGNPVPLFKLIGYTFLPDKTEYIKTEMTDTEQSFYPADAAECFAGHVENRMDRMDNYRELLADNIGYEALCHTQGAERMEGVLDLLAETVCTNRKTVRVGGEDMPTEVVRSRLLKLDCSHIEYVFECMKANTTKIQNIQAYLLAALYREPTTIEPYYCAEVKHDLYGGGG